MTAIVWKDYVPDSEITAAHFGTTVINAITHENVKTPQIGTVARWTFGAESPDTQGVRLRFDFGEMKDINFAAILGHNVFTATEAGPVIARKMRLKLGTTLGGNEVYDDGASYVDLWEPGTYDAPNQYRVLDATYSAQYAEITIGATNNSTIDIGRIWIGESWSANVSMEFGMGVRDLGSKSRSRSGATWSNTRRKLKTMDVRCYGLSDADFFGTSSDFDSFMEIDLAVGDTGHVILLPRNDNEHERHRMGIYGTIENNGPVRVVNRTSGGLFTEKRFTVVESR